MNWLNELYKMNKQEPDKEIERSLVNAIFRIYDRFPELALESGSDSKKCLLISPMLISMGITP